MSLQPRFRANAGTPVESILSFRSFIDSSYTFQGLATKLISPIEALASGYLEDVVNQHDQEHSKVGTFVESFLNALPFPADVVDEDMNVIYMNQELEGVVGKEALGKKCYLVFKDNREQCADCPLVKPSNMGGGRTLEVEGALGGRTLRITHRAIDLGGRKAIVETLEDITERKQDAELVRALSDHATVGIYIVQDGRFRFVNPEFQRQTGYGEDELLGADPLRLVLPEDRHMVRLNAVKMLKGERHLPHEFRILSKAGEIRWILETVVSIRYGGGRATLGHFMDITERKRHEEERVLFLQEQAARAEAEAARQQIRSILESISDAFVAVDREGRFTYVNKEAGRFMQRRPEDLIGKNGSEEFPEVLGSQFYEECEKAFSGQVTVEFQTFYSPLNSWLEVRAYPSEDGLSVYFRDISKRKLAEQFRDEYVSLISHDLRNPLTIVQGQAQLLMKSLERAGVSDLGQRNIEAIISSSRRIDSMVKDLTESARLEAGQLRIEKQSVALGPFVFDLLERVRGVMDVGRVKLQMVPELPPVSADPDRLERILMNLLSNALKYSPPGSEVMIAAERSYEQVMVSVVDRGMGIAPEETPLVFERFYRTKEARKAEGLGLGLYITRLLVDAHGGRIWVESEKGKGSTFYFILPMEGPIA